MAQRLRFNGDSRHEFIAQLWALRRVGWLLDEIRLRGKNKELRDEVVDLARRFAIVTPYTSYLIVEDEARRGVPLAAQSFGRLSQDERLRRQLGESWHDYSGDKDGYVGTLNARSNGYFKFAERPAETQVQAQAESKVAAAAKAAPLASLPYGGAVTMNQRGIVVSGAGQIGENVRKLDAVEQQARWVNGKAFTQNGPAWNDTAVQNAQANAKRNRVQFASKDYFDLLTQEPDAAQWLALGNVVTFALRDQIYEIYE
jgi:Ca-activated chloride channel family protein